MEDWETLRQRTRALEAAAQKCDLPAIKKLIADAESPASALLIALKSSDLPILCALIEDGTFGKSDYDALLFHSAHKGREAIAIHMLELRANPLQTQSTPYGDPQSTPFSQAAKHAEPELALAMASRLTQEQKNERLRFHVKRNEAECVRVLLGAGADALHTRRGRTPLQLAPPEAEEIKRMLRAIETAANIEAAMGGHDVPPPPKSSFTL